MRRLELDDLNLFVKAVAAGNLSAAGRELGLSPAVASKRIAGLETRVGARLLHRTTRAVTPTEEGTAFHAHALRVLEEMEEAMAAVRADGAPRGHLRVTVPASFGLMHISPLVPEFLRDHPEVTMELHMADSLVDIVDEGFDCAIRIGALKDSTLVARRLAPNRRIVCASPDYLARMGTPTRIQQLVEHNCLVHNDQNLWEFDTPQGRKGVRVSGSLKTNHAGVLRDAVVKGLGIARKSTWDIGEQLAKGDLVPLFPDCCIATDVAVWAVYPSARFVAPKVRAFIGFLAERFGPEPYWDQGLPERFRV